MTCQHQWIEVRRDENPNRIRTRETCLECTAWRTGCFAKRTETVGPFVAYAAWGPVGVWSYSEVRDERPTCPECGGDLGGNQIGRLEDHKGNCSRLPL